MSSWRVLSYLVLTLLTWRQDAEAEVSPVHHVYTMEAFYVPISKKSFGKMATAKEVEFRPALLDMPDLPSWMSYRHPNGSEEAYLYGSPTKPGVVQIEIVAMDTYTFQTARRIMTFKVESRGYEPKYGVSMKLKYLNVEDMFESERLRDLSEIFRNRLWRNCNYVNITGLASAVEVGGRYPPDPREKEGVVVTIGGDNNFSRDLVDLEREVQPLRNRYPCPPKKTSVEHYFHNKNFTSEWCSFRLIRPPEPEDSKPSYSPISLTSEDYHPRTREIPRREFLVDFIVSIGIPALIALIFVTCLTYVMFCNREGLVKGMSETANVQANRYSSMRRTGSDSRPVSGKMEGIPHSESTPGSSLPRSRAESPSSTGAKSLMARPNSRTGTLRNPCPPPPYTPPNTTLKRGGTIQPPTLLPIPT